MGGLPRETIWIFDVAGVTSPKYFLRSLNESLSGGHRLFYRSVDC